LRDTSVPPRARLERAVTDHVVLTVTRREELLAGNPVLNALTADQQADIAALTTGLIGPATPLPQIDAARLAILQRYRADGYVLSAVSINFNAATGALRFIVTEGRIASVKLDGDIGPAGTQVLRFLNRLTEKRPIDAATLERYLLLAQEVPGVTLHAVLQPSADDPGALTLVAGEVVAFVSFALVQAVLSGHHDGVSLKHPGVPGAVLAVGLLLFVVATMGLGLGAIVRHTAGGIAALVGLIFLPAIINLLPAPWGARIGRFTLLDAARQVTALHPATNLFAPAWSLLVLLAWPALTLLAAALLITRRDA